MLIMKNLRQYIKPGAELLCFASFPLLVGSNQRPGGTIRPFEWEDDWQEDESTNDYTWTTYNQINSIYN